jgi:hypothetical protein
MNRGRGGRTRTSWAGTFANVKTISAARLIFPACPLFLASRVSTSVVRRPKEPSISIDPYFSARWEAQREDVGDVHERHGMHTHQKVGIVHNHILDSHRDTTMLLRPSNFEWNHNNVGRYYRCIIPTNS